MKKKYIEILTIIYFFLCSTIYANDITEKPDWIIEKPIIFNDLRKNLTKQYAEIHYGRRIISIKPVMIVVHYTACSTIEGSFSTFNKVEIHDRKYLEKFGKVNVSAHYLVNRDGAVYKLMPDNLMARHTIGLNHCSIGIENVGSEDLTGEQLKSNIKLIRYLKKKYPEIEYLIGHYEYKNFENSELFIEKIPDYRTIKKDPGKSFMFKLRNLIKDLKLNSSP